jgi:hypothetical protein
MTVSPRAPFSVAVIGDTQNYSSYRNQREGGFPFNAREMLWDMMHHIARNAQANGGRIAFATGLGDSWQHPSSWEPDAPHLARGISAIPNPAIEALIPASPRQVAEIEVPAIRHAYEIIADELPFSLVPGNHDHDHIWSDPACPPSPDAWIRDGMSSGLGWLHVGGLDNWTRNFGSDSSLFAGKSWYVASYKNGCNAAQIFEGGGYRFLHIGLEMCPQDDIVAWAEQVILDHPGLPTIIAIHEFIDEHGERQSIECFDLTRIDPDRNSPQMLWDKLIARHDQVLITLNGHFHGVQTRIDRNAHGHKVYQFLVNYQCRKQSYKDSGSDAEILDGIGDGWLRLMTFDLDRAVPQLSLSAYSTHYKGFAHELPLYAQWYGYEHAELSAEDFVALDHCTFDLDDFRARFGAPAAAVPELASAD